MSTQPEAGLVVTEQVLCEARGWVGDCAWREEPQELDELPDAAILAGLDRHYAGGLPQSLRDTQPR